MSLLNITHYTVSSALGHGRAAHAAALGRSDSGLRKAQFDGAALDCWLGEVTGLETPLPPALAAWECRNHRLALLGLQQDGFSDAVAKARARYGAARIGVFIGTSTAGIHHGELAYRDCRADGALPDWFDYRHTQNLFSTTDFVAQALALRGHALTISTACSSSAKVFAVACRAMRMGLCDAAVVGGVDSLCLTTLYGFNSLQLVAADVCRPADATRNGISIGEAAGFALLEVPTNAAAFALLGYGESSDAHHMSAPDPDGHGAAAAMHSALQRAGCEPGAVDYVNLHGTGTQANDAAEDKAVFAVFGADTPCSSTKGWTGHTLGAAGIVEAVLALLCMEHGLLPRSLQTRSKDASFRSNVLLTTRRAALDRVLSNSFGFGGSNCSLLFGRAA